MEIVQPGGMAAKFGSASGGHKSEERVRHNATVEWAIGTIFNERDGFYVVVASFPVTSAFGPRWDVHLRRAPPEVQLAAEVMIA